MLTERIIQASLIAALALPLVAGAQMSPPEHRTDRPGEDLRNFTASRWQECSSSCASQKECWAYTFVAGSGGGTCWLKDGVPPARSHNIAISGVKVMGPIERGLDRPGEDLRSGFPSDDPPACLRACQGESNCWSWTWVKPKGKGKGACWLKGNAPTAITNDCCFSGIRVVATSGNHGKSLRAPSERPESLSRQTASRVAPKTRPEETHSNAGNKIGKPKTSQATQTGPNPTTVLVTAIPNLSLKVRTGNKEFTQWKSAITINGPQVLGFNFTTNAMQATQATWQVYALNQSDGEEPLAQAALLVSPSSQNPFEVNFNFIPEWPPAPPHAFLYQVNVLLTDAKGKIITAQGSVVEVSYRAASGSTSIDVCDGPSDCDEGYYCDNVKGSCQRLTYACAAESWRHHLIVGTDGSVGKNCTPYRCEDNPLGGSFCPTQCASTGECAVGWNCNAEGKCVVFKCSKKWTGCPNGWHCSGDKQSSEWDDGQYFKCVVNTCSARFSKTCAKGWTCSGDKQSPGWEDGRIFNCLQD